MCPRPDTGHEAMQQVEVADILRTHGAAYQQRHRLSGGQRRVEARLRDLLPIPYFHCVFTLPHTLNPLAQGNSRVLYGLLFQTAAATLQTSLNFSQFVEG